MSVAFRRESDEEHKEPRFEIPIPPGPNLVTPRGLALLEARVAALEAAIEGETDDVALATLKRDLRYVRVRLTTARIAPPPPLDRVAIGARVGYRLDGEARSVDIVGGDEADPANGRIAFFAPLARALIGCSVGDLVDWGGTSEAIEIAAIASADDQAVIH